MNDLKLTALGVREIDAKTRLETKGGIAPVAAGIIIAVAVEILRDWDSFERGLAGRCV